MYFPNWFEYISKSIINMLLFYFTILYRSGVVLAYSNNLFTISKSINPYQREDICSSYENKTNLRLLEHAVGEKESKKLAMTLVDDNVLTIEEDPYNTFQSILHTFLFGENYDPYNTFQSILHTFLFGENYDPYNTFQSILHTFLFGENYDPYNTFQSILHTFLFGENYVAMEELNILSEAKNINNFDRLLHYPSGNSMRKAELFENKTGVHLPLSGMIHDNYCRLNITDDYMQTAVDAFAIFVDGSLYDIERLPPDYVLRSARTISMMKISIEKLTMTWKVVKGDLDTIDVPYETLEQYRPLFKYLNGKEIARLNLMDPRILKYIGTHPDLDRHQVKQNKMGVVASKYIKLNSHWMEPKYLNMMNNLICGVPMTFMRKVPENTFLQLSHQALGKAYSWNAQDVSRLGILLAEVEGPDLGSIKPEALAGLTAQVMMVMKPRNLQFLTKAQMRFISDKPLNIMAKKLREYQDQNNPSSCFRHMGVSDVVMSAIILTCLLESESHL